MAPVGVPESVMLEAARGGIRNSQRTRRDVVAKLSRMGIDVDDEHIFTCAMATARFLAQQKPAGTAFVIELPAARPPGGPP